MTSPIYEESRVWQPTRTGDWAVDNAEGRRLAETLIRDMRDADNPTLLGHKVRAIIAAGRYEGVEVGFFTRIAVEAIAR